MTARPPSICRFPGCGKKIPRAGHCEAHQREVRKASDSRRESSHQRGYGWKWRQYAEHFKRANPLCAHCLAEGVIPPRATTEVDHITPHRGDMRLFWDKANHQGLCKPHHSRKTASEDGGFGNGS